jgi:thiamine kinase-like enzyme
MLWWLQSGKHQKVHDWIYVWERLNAVNALKTKRVLENLWFALGQEWPTAAPFRLEPLKAKGLAHDHVRLIGTGYLARIPKQSQMQLGAHENLVYQQACFDRASAAGFAPRCIRTMAPCAHLPRGALIVEEIVGRHAQLPQDLPLMARSLAAIHRLPLPSDDHMSPLLHAADPLQAMWEEVATQATYLPQADLVPNVAVRIKSELAQFQAICTTQQRPMRRLIAFDGHPGNFVISEQGDHGRAYLVDLEKCRYSHPSFDLAHATLYTSTTWDVDAHTVLSPDQVLETYRVWQNHVDEALADDAQRWHLPLRRAMWLWSITWCAKWRVASRAAAAQDAGGEDWSAQNIDAALASHVRERVDHYLSSEGVEWVMDEFAALQHHWNARKPEA